MGSIIQQPNLSRRGFRQWMTARLTFADDAVTYVLPTLPAGTIIHSAYHRINTLFNDTGTDLINLGTVADPDRYIDDQDVSSAGFSTTDTANVEEQWTAATPLQALYTGSNSDSTAGEVDIFIEFTILPFV